MRLRNSFRYKDFGSTGLKVSELSLGTWGIGGAYTCNCARDTILRECEKSLRNLRTDRIDCYLVHWPDANVPIEETMDALMQLKQAGKICHIGVPNFSPEQILEARKYGPVEMLQKQYSMASQESEADLKWTAGQNMGVMTYGSLGTGILSGKIRKLESYQVSDNRSRFYKFFREPAFSAIMELLQVMDGISARRDSVPLAQIALNWVARRSPLPPPVSWVPRPGTRCWRTAQPSTGD